MKQETMPEGQSMGLEEQLRSLSPIIKAAMEKKAVINLTIYAGNIGQKIDNATHVFMEADDECRRLLRKETMEGREETADEEENEDVLPSAEELAAACVKTQEEGLWWGNASWSVTFRIYCILGYNGNTVKVDNLAIFKVSVIGNGCKELYDATQIGRASCRERVFLTV